MAKSNKNGWGQAREGKVSGDTTGTYGEYKESNVKSSRNANGLNSKWQGQKGIKSK